MSPDLKQEIYNSFRLKDTDELLRIWTSNDRVEWSDTAFEAVKQILRERHRRVPRQGAPILKHEQPVRVDEDEEDENAPVFYEPKDVERLGAWLNIVAVVAIAVTVLMSVTQFNSLHFTIRDMLPIGQQADLLAWGIALLIGGAAIALQCFIYYAAMKGLASVLMILMEMEHNSRAG